MSLFIFLHDEWPELFAPAAQAESLVYPDSRSSCFHARRALELAVHWLYKHDSTLKLPYQDHLSALVHEPTFRRAVGPAIFAKIKVIKDLGNLAVHSHKPVRQLGALTATKELSTSCSGWRSPMRVERSRRTIFHSIQICFRRAAVSRRRPWNNCRS